MPSLLTFRAKLSWAGHLLGRLRPEVRSARSERARFYGDMWRETAEAIGAQAIDCGGDLLRIERHDRQTYVFRNYTDLDGPATLRACGNKPLVHAALAELGLPTPSYCEFTLKRFAVAQQFMAEQGKCVVKPAAGTGAGQGVTTGIETSRQLRRAVVAASAFGNDLLIEQQIAGHNVRLLYLDGELLDAVHRRPPVVIGDGRSTIGQLVKRANKERLAGGYQVAQVALGYDADMRTTLAAQGLCWRSTPTSGREVQLKTVINDNAASENVSVVDQLSPVTVEIGRRAATALGVRLAGVDLVIDDLAADLPAAGVVLEINTTPGLYIHRASGSVQVAIPILEAALANRSPAEPRPLAASLREASSC